MWPHAVGHDFVMSLVLRTALPSDDGPLADLDRRCWAVAHEVAPRRPPGTPFFDCGTSQDDVLVAELDGALVGWTKLGRPTPVASNAHVKQVQGLGVDPDVRRRGVGRALINGVCDLAQTRGARRIWLRVLSTNPDAIRLYETSGFAVEGVLHGEFLLAGRYVDDVIMGRSL
jgi:ribosomal protein S18 acetylase RimI-like enzyme